MNGKTDETEVPSQSAANKVLRVLTGKPLKYTVRIHKADGSVIEFQSNCKPDLKWDNEARSLWIKHGEYDGTPIMPYEAGTLIMTEENPQ